MKTFPGEQRIVWNPVLSLFLVPTVKGIAVNRPVDGQRIATVSVKDHGMIVDYQWEQSEGRVFAVCHSNGIIRLYDSSLAGKSVGSVILGDSNCDVLKVCWSQDSWTFGSKFSNVFDHEITSLMPRLVKFVKDSRQLTMLPTDVGDGVPRWSKLDGNKSFIFLGYDSKRQEILMAIDGAFKLSFSVAALVAAGERLDEGDNVPNNVRDILKYDNGEYLVITDDWYIQKIKFDFLNCNLTREMISCCNRIRALHKQLHESVSLVKTELVEPYMQFIERVLSAYEGDLIDDLTELLFTGSVPPELEDWLSNTIGDKNLRRWKKLSSVMYENAVKIMVLTMVPVCERLILCGERLHGIIKGLKLIGLKEPEDNLEVLEAQKLVCLSQEALETIIVSIKQINVDSNLHEAFIDWFHDTVMEAVDEDYKRKTPYNYDPLKIQQFMSGSLTGVHTYEWCQYSFPAVTNRLGKQFETVEQLYVANWVVQRVKFGEPICIKKGLEKTRVKDVGVDTGKQLLFLYQDNDSKELVVSRYSLDLDPTTNNIAQESITLTIEDVSPVKDAKFSADYKSIFVLHENGSGLSQVELQVNPEGKLFAFGRNSTLVDDLQNCNFDSIQISRHQIALVSSNRNRFGIASPPRQI